jgi:hypothetical protein
VSFAAITLCVTPQRVFIIIVIVIIVVVYSVTDLVKCDPRFSVISEMADLKEQRICVKFCFRLGRTSSETHEMLKTAFGDNSMGRTQTFEWFCRFKHRKASIEDSERSVRPSTGRTDENVENVGEIVNNTSTKIAGRLGLSYGTWRLIVTEDLNMRQISGAQCFVCAAIFGP